MQLIGIFFMKALEDYHLRSHTENIYSQANVLSDFLERYYVADSWQESSQLDALVQDFARQTRSDIQVIDEAGIILSDSIQPALVGQRNLQLDVTRALLGARSETIRLAPSTGQRIKIYAAPIKKEDQIVGAIYLSSSLENIYLMLQDINKIISTATLIVLLVSSLLVILIARTISYPLTELTSKAEKMANGDFEQTVKVYGNDEISRLGKAFNQLTTQLNLAIKDNKQERQRLEAILHNMSDGVIATRIDGKIILINPAAQRMIGISEEKALIKSVLDIIEVNELKKDWLQLKKRSAIITKIQHNQALYQLYISPLHSNEAGASREAGEMGILLIMHDITDREALESQRRDFVANVSHELRTPLTTIRSYVEALQEGADEDIQTRRRFIDVIRQEAERMIRLVTELLELSKLDAKSLKWNFQVIDLNELVEDVYDRFQVQLANHNITSELKLMRAPIKVRVDVDRIDQVLNNLLSNALKYSVTDGKIVVDSSIVWHEERQYAQISVADTGMGIPATDVSQVFDRFFRVDKARSRERGGTGLGLSITKQIIKAHGGEIQIRSKVDKGTTVIFSLPIEEGYR